MVKLILNMIDNIRQILDKQTNIGQILIKTKVFTRFTKMKGRHNNQIYIHLTTEPQNTCKNITEMKTDNSIIIVETPLP